MNRRGLAALLCVLLLAFASGIAVAAADAEDKPFSITFDNPRMTEGRVTVDVDLNNTSAAAASASLIDLHLAVTGTYQSVGTNSNGMKATAGGSTIRLYRDTLESALEVPAGRTLCLCTLTIAPDTADTVAIQRQDGADADQISGISSGSYQDSLLSAITPFSYTVTPGVAVSGRVTSYNPNNPVTVRLYLSSDTGHETAQYETTLAAASGSGQITQDFRIDGVARGTYDLVITKPCHLTCTVFGVTVDSSALDLTAAAGKPYQACTLLAGDVNSDGSITESDVTVIRYSTNINKSTTAAANALADVNGDGSVTESDVTIVRYSTHINKSTTHCTYSF